MRNRIRVLFDHQTFSAQQHGGISRYFASLISGIRNMEVIFPIVFSENVYFKEYGIKVKNVPSFILLGKRTLSNYINKLYTLIYLAVYKSKYDVFHPTYYNDMYFLKLQRKPLVITIHDMIHEIMPDGLHKVEKIVNNKRKLIEKADRIIAISNSTKKDILRIYPHIEEEKIMIVHHGFLMSSLNFSTQKRIIEAPYILFIGERNHYKNFDRMLNAISPILLSRKELKLVCTGRAFDKKERDLIEKLMLKDKITLFKNADEKTLAGLYMQASVFIFPSMYEGFGFPILEAFFYGTPACISLSSSFPEVAGDAAVYFDPYNEEEIRSAVEKILDNPGLCKELVKKGKKRLEHFTVEKMIAETENVYKSIFNKK